MSNILDKEQAILIGNIHRTNHYHYDGGNENIAERRPLYPKEVWIDIGNIPPIPPVQTPFPGTASGSASGVSNVQMVFSPGSTTVLVSNPANNFIDMIPSNYYGGVYQPTLTDATGRVIPFNPSVWVADGILGEIQFLNVGPVELGYIMPLSFSYWRYNGAFAGGGGGSSLWQRGPDLLAPTQTNISLAAPATATDVVVFPVQSTERPVGSVIPEYKFFFIPSGLDAGALRAGMITDTKWNAANRGGFSVAFGRNNTATGIASSVVGGTANTTSAGADNSFIGGGVSNIVNPTGDRAAIVGGSGNIASGLTSFIGGGNSNNATGSESVVCGGSSNNLSNNGGDQSFIGGGTGNTASASITAIVGGSSNIANGTNSFIGGGSSNSASSISTVICGGVSNLINANGEYSFIGSGGGTGLGNFISGQKSAVVCGATNSARGTHNFIGGGFGNTTRGDYSVAVGGFNNNTTVTNNSDYSTLVGGQTNNAAGAYSVVVGGINNSAPQTHAAVVGGSVNTASGDSSFIGGGAGNVASGPQSVVAGGTGNTAAGGPNNTIPGGNNINITNTTGGSFACGSTISCTRNNAFIWSDGTGGVIDCTADNTFTILSTDGGRILTNVARTTGVSLVGGSSAWAAVSDRRVKENIRELDPAEVLTRVETLPIYEYNYIGTEKDLLCRGPMAQDWHEAFPSGKDPLTIDTMDLDGITLAAVKGLAARVREQDERIAKLEKIITGLTDKK
jgi:hypothetical protein